MCTCWRKYPCQHEAPRHRSQRTLQQSQLCLDVGADPEYHAYAGFEGELLLITNQERLAAAYAGCNDSAFAVVPSSLSPLLGSI